ncbi:MAG: hypothetical protein K2N30_02375 [Clostridia bacterium]|nr:hypothetical protein [Clostridia bacterium]
MQGKVLYVDKEKSQELAKIPGIQFPDNFATLDFDIIIRKINAFVNIAFKTNALLPAAPKPPRLTVILPEGLRLSLSFCPRASPEGLRLSLSF